MKRISRAHRDGQDTKGPNIVNALLQVTLLHVLLETDYPLGILNNPFVGFLDCLIRNPNDVSSLEKFIVEKLSSLQKDKLNNLIQFEKYFQGFNGKIQENSPAETITPYDVINFNNLLDKVNESIKIEGGLVIIQSIFSKVLQGITSKLNSSLPSYQKIAKEKIISFIVLIGKVSGAKQLLDQLADASFTVWDTILHEVEFSQVFNREMSKCGIALSENDIEKTLLFLNRIRIQLGIENNNIFLEFCNRITHKITKAITENIISSTERSVLFNVNKRWSTVYYKKISFKKTNEIILNFDYMKWSDEIQRIEEVSI
ncbi:unnamed protein product [Rotaria magnacalcarata]|uniref:Uncharacterized protein n=1 Tax=Rotaria magnacalcarata TaxID=392030 RepID=A0A820RK98_9BILA|nr:unnamed protein product [Rotaria magnacalcarata]